MNIKRSAMTLYSDSRDHYSHRVRIVLAEKGVGVDVVPCDPAKLPSAVQAMNPYGTLPVFVDREELVLYEARVIMEYLDERFPHPPLMPVYPVARAKSRLWIHRLDRDWIPLVDVLLQGRDKARIPKARTELRESLVAIAPVFADKPFFMSDEFTLMDCCLAAMLWRLPSMGIEFEDTPKNKPLLDYMARLFSREAFQASLSDEERILRK